MSKEMAIIGAVPMGPATVYYALKKGYKVKVFEARDKIGGMTETCDVPCMISISNLNTELEDKVVYLPFYLHINNQKYHEPDINFYNKFLDYAKIINSDFDESWVKDYRVFKYEYAQPVATTGFLSKLPTIRSDERKGFLIADTAYYYPEDRSITESVALGKKLVEMI